LRPVEIGTVARAHGVRGEVRIRLHWADSHALETVRSVWIGRPGAEPREYRVASVRAVAKAALVQLDGIADRDAAERLRGSIVSVPRDVLPPLEPGEYYLCDLVGARVVAPEGEVGRVVEVRVHPSVDSVVVETPDGRQLEQPLVEPWLDEVDAEGGIVRLTTTDGMV
jgi:16S rRNA processing protein RimM